MYAIGNQVRLTGTFATVAGVATDPTAVSLVVVDPAANVTTYTYPAAIVKEGVGVYHCDLAPASSGQWRYRWVGTGAVAATAESSFVVKANSF